MITMYFTLNGMNKLKLKLNIIINSSSSSSTTMAFVVHTDESVSTEMKSESLKHSVNIKSKL